jgi:histidinol-phosphatase (PHP family)
MVNYHVHTPRCGHASGSPEEYVQRAIDAGLREIGFSDHAPIPLPMRQGITMEPGEEEDYLEEILLLQKRYSGNIAVRAGFEVDYPIFDTFNSDYFVDGRIDYLIGSCHFIGTWAFDHPDQIDGFSTRDINDIYREYLAIIAGLSGSGFFNIIGHFDLVKKFGHRATADLSGEIERLAAVVARSGAAVEVNTSGLLKPVAEMYPSKEIMEILFANNVPVTLGTDAHAPENVAYRLDEAIALIRSVGYRTISAFKNRKRYDMTL